MDRGMYHKSRVSTVLLSCALLFPPNTLCQYTFPIKEVLLSCQLCVSQQGKLGLEEVKEPPYEHICGKWCNELCPLPPHGAWSSGTIIGETQPSGKDHNKNKAFAIVLPLKYSHMWFCTCTAGNGRQYYFKSICCSFIF